MARRRRQWIKVWQGWYNGDSHEDLSGDALNAGPRLMWLAEASPVWGELRGPDEKPLTLATIAKRLRWPVRRTKALLAELEAVKTLGRTADGAWMFPHFAEHQETPQAARTRAYRDKQPGHKPVTVTPQVTGRERRGEEKKKGGEGDTSHPPPPPPRAVRPVEPVDEAGTPPGCDLTSHQILTECQQGLNPEDAYRLAPKDARNLDVLLASGWGAQEVLRVLRVASDICREDTEQSRWWGPRMFSLEPSRSGGAAPWHVWVSLVAERTAAAPAPSRPAEYQPPVLPTADETRESDAAAEREADDFLKRFSDV